MSNLKRSKVQVTRSIIAGLSVLTVMISLIFLVLENNEQQQTVEHTESIVEKKLTNIKELSKEDLERDSISQLIKSYNNAVFTKDAFKAASFYAPTVERYFLKENLSQDEILLQIKHFVHSDIANVRIKRSAPAVKFEGNTATAIQEKVLFRDSTETHIVTEFKFDQHRKIISIRDFYPENYEVDSTFY